MNKENSLNSSNEQKALLHEFYFVPYSQDLINYLSQGYQIKNEKHVNRLFAFNDLIKRCYLKEMLSDSLDAYPKAQISTNIKSLSQAWGWSRPATSNFISKLVDFGIVSIATHGCSKIVSMASLSISTNNRPSGICESSQGAQNASYAASQERISKSKTAISANKPKRS